MFSYTTFGGDIQVELSSQHIYYPYLTFTTRALFAYSQTVGNSKMDCEGQTLFFLIILQMDL